SRHSAGQARAAGSPQLASGARLCRRFDGTILSPSSREPWIDGSKAARTAPKVLEPMRRQLGVAHRVLDVFVAEPCLQRPGVMAGLGERVAAAVPQHVRVDWERHFGPLSDPAE